MEETKGKKEKKLCGVCGDFALGSNFNAITCESCKAFFRRNALKTKEFKCPFENNCKVDVITRRFCQKCRLKKCFAIGMKKEWIMSEEEKKAKREKIENNRKKRNSQQAASESLDYTFVKTENSEETQDVLNYMTSAFPMTPQTPGSAGVTPDLPKPRAFHQPLTPSDSEFSPPAKKLHLDTAESVQEALLFSDESCHPEYSNLEDSCSKMKSDSEESQDVNACKEQQSNNLDEESKSRLLIPKTNVYSPSSSHVLDNIPECVYAKVIEIEFTELPIRNSLMKSKELNYLEKQKLEELIVANEVLKMPLVCGVSDPSLLDVINMTDHAIRRLIKMSKKINGFKNLCQDDQIALLKGGCTELMILRSVMSYDPEKGCWEHSRTQGLKAMSIKVDVLKEAKGNVYEEHKRFINSFHPQWRTDENIMLILSGIALFTPERPNTVHKEAIKIEQDTYYYLLQRYLDSVCSWCEAKAVYLQLVHKIQELHILNENHVRVYLDVNPKDVEPLLIEIFDLKH